MICTHDFLFSILYGVHEVPFVDEHSLALVDSYEETDDGSEDVFTEQSPQQHSTTRLGFRLTPRTIPMTFLIQAGNRAAFETKRARLNNLLAASDTPLTLKFILLPSHRERRIKVYSQGGINLPSQERLGTIKQVVQVSFVADDPTFYDPITRSLAFALAGGSGTPVPTPVPTPIGPSALSATQTGLNRGTWMAFPDYTLRGPMRGLVIENRTLAVASRPGYPYYRLAFKPGVEIPHGETWTLTTAFGNKRLLDANGVNRNAYLADPHDLNKFHLAYHTEVLAIEPPTPNDIHVEFQGGNAYSRVTMEWTERFQSLWG